MTKIYPPEVLRKFFINSFIKLEVPEEIYSPVIEGLINTALRGIDSHGVRLFPHYTKMILSGRINKNPHFTFNKKAASAMIMDADNGFGITASVFAMKKAIEIPRETGVGVVTVINSSHFGAAGIYSLMAAKNNMIGICCTHTEALVVPYEGKIPFLGTNAFTFAAPCEGEEPFCLDMATSTTSLNKIRKYKEGKKEFEKEWVVDKYGNYCTNPEKEVYLTHFGGYKGYGISMVVEILCSILTGMNFGPEITPMFSDFEKQRHLGHFFLAINISKFQDILIFKKRFKNLIDSLRKEPHKENLCGIKVANDPEKENFRLRSKIGIPVSEIDLENFKEIADLLKLDKSILENYKNIDSTL